MVLLRVLLDGILDSVSGDHDDTWMVEKPNSSEQCHMVFNRNHSHSQKPRSDNQDLD